MRVVSSISSSCNMWHCEHIQAATKLKEICDVSLKINIQSLKTITLFHSIVGDNGTQLHMNQHHNVRISTTSFKFISCVSRKFFHIAIPNQGDGI